MNSTSTLKQDLLSLITTWVLGIRLIVHALLFLVGIVVLVGFLFFPHIISEEINNLDLPSTMIFFLYGLATVVVLSVGLYGVGYGKKWGLFLTIIFFLLHDLLLGILVLSRNWIISVGLIGYGIIAIILLIKSYPHLSS